MSENLEAKPASFCSKEFKRVALAKLNGRWTTPVLVSLISGAILLALIGVFFPWSFYVNLIVSGGEGVDISAFPFGRYFLTLIICVFLTPVIMLAEMSIYPLLYKSEEPLKISDFISGFSLWGKAIGAFWWQYLWLYLWGLLGALIGLVAGLIIGGIISAVAQSTVALMIIAPITIYAGLFAALIVKAYEYSMTEYALVDNPDLGVKQSLNISKAVTAGYKWKIFCVDFSFIGWSLLCSFFPIGQLWLTPYMRTAFMGAYYYLLEDYNKRMGAAVVSDAPKAIEDEPVNPETDTTDDNSI